MPNITTMNKWSEIILGLIFLIGAVLVAIYSSSWGAWNFLNAAWEVIKGSTIIFVAIIGLLLILLGISDLKE
jgi:hypothetical protein